MRRERVREINPLPRTQLGMLSLIGATYDKVRSIHTAFYQEEQHPRSWSPHLVETGCATWEAAEAKVRDQRSYLHLLLQEYQSKYAIDLSFLLEFADSLTVFQQWEMLVGGLSALTPEQRALIRTDVQRDSS